MQLNEGLTTLDEDCFAATALKLVNFPLSVREINNGAFQKCRDLWHLNIPRNGDLQRIGIRAFSETSVKEFQAPCKLTQLAQSAFSKCKELHRVVLNTGLRSLGTPDVMEQGNKYCGVFEDSGLSEIVLPSTL